MRRAISMRQCHEREARKARTYFHSSDDLPKITEEWLAGAPPFGESPLNAFLEDAASGHQKMEGEGPDWQTRMVKVLKQAAPKSRFAV